jgi:hypothetical protein
MRSRARFAQWRDRDDAESGAAPHHVFSAINQKHAPPRESRNPLRYPRFEMRAAAPARQGT